MPQISKIIQSRDRWKDKAVQRANKIRDNRKSKKRSQDKIAELELQIRALEQKDEGKKTVTPALERYCDNPRPVNPCIMCIARHTGGYILS